MTEPAKPRTFTREQFYDFVWSAPVAQLTAELGCTTAVLTNVCRTFDVPRPYHRYWQQLAAGKAPSRTPLPANDRPTLQTLTFSPRPDRAETAAVPPREAEYDPEVRQLLQKARDLGPLCVPESLQDPHSLVVLTQRTDAATASPESETTTRRPGPLRPPSRRRLDCDVSRSLRDRAYRLLDALIKHVEAIGGQVRIVPSDDRRTSWVTAVLFAGEEVSRLRLREKFNQVKVKPKKSELPWDWPRTELVPSGLLVLEDDFVHSGPLAIDGKHLRIEDRLSRVIFEFIRQLGERRLARREALAAAEIAAERERTRQAQEAELARRRADLERRQNAESAEVDRLFRQAVDWERSCRLRDFLDALCNSNAGANGTVDVDSELATFLRWGFAQADRLDPLRPSPPSVLDERIEPSGRYEP